jgi:peroxiredoxin
MGARRQRRLLDPGARAPDIRLPSLDGGEAALRDLWSGGPVLLAFFKVTCPVCQFTLPYLDRIHRGGSVPVYGVSQNDPEETREFNREFGVDFPMLLDPEENGFPASNDFGISSVPTVFLVERDGRISRVMEGWCRKDMEWLGHKAGTRPFREGERIPDWKAG